METLLKLKQTVRTLKNVSARLINFQGGNSISYLYCSIAFRSRHSLEHKDFFKAKPKGLCSQKILWSKAWMKNDGKEIFSLLDLRESEASKEKR